MKRNEANWSQERLDIVRKMDAEGHSRREISIVLGVTRNAVCGKLARMPNRPKREPRPTTERDRLRKAKQRVAKKAVGLVRVGNDWKPKATVPKPGNAYGNLVRMRQVRAGVAPLPKPIRAPPAAPASATNTTLLKIGHGQCRYPIGEAKERAVLFCGAKAEGSWCPYHRLIVWQPNEERRTKRQPVSTYRQFGEVA